MDKTVESPDGLGNRKIAIRIAIAIAVGLTIVLFVAWETKREARAEANKYTASFAINGVQRILMHEPKRYTFLVKQPNSDTLASLSSGDLWGGGRMPRQFIFIADVPGDKEMWLNLKYVVASKQEEGERKAIKKYDTMEIHVHTAKDVNGAGWDHGKYGQGQTTTIE